MSCFDDMLNWDAWFRWETILLMLYWKLCGWCDTICVVELLWWCIHSFIHHKLLLLWKRRLQVLMLGIDNCPKLNVVAWSSVLELRVAEWNPWICSWLGPNSCKEPLLRSISHAYESIMLLRVTLHTDCVLWWSGWNLNTCVVMPSRLYLNCIIFNLLRLFMSHLLFECIYHPLYLNVAFTLTSCRYSGVVAAVSEVSSRSYFFSFVVLEVLL